MRFARLGRIGAETPVVERDGSWFDITPLTADIDGAFLAGGGPEAVRSALDSGTLAELPDATSLRIGPPIARPSAVICIGQNYAAHAAESGSPPPPIPIVFLKTPNTVGGPNDDVVIPRNSTQTDWEVELGVVIGTRATYLDGPEQSREHIAGFVSANDVSEREFQRELSGGQWSKGKIAPGFAPVGPWLVTPDEVDYQNLSIRSWVNGEPRQDSTTADQIFGVDHLIWHLSQFTALEPGDLVLTGTPEGVAMSGRFPYLSPGDICEIEVEGLGRQRQRFVEWSAG